MSFQAMDSAGRDVSIEACVSACGNNNYTYAAGQVIEE